MNHSDATPAYRFGPFLLMHQGRTLERNGEPCGVPAKALSVLLVLLQAEGRVVSKNELISAVWPDSFVEDGTLTQNIWTLRKVLGDAFPEKSPIETISRVGYRFAAPVTLEVAAAASPALTDSEPVRAEPEQGTAKPNSEQWLETSESSFVSESDRSRPSVTGADRLVSGEPTASEAVTQATDAQSARRARMGSKPRRRALAVAAASSAVLIAGLIVYLHPHRATKPVTANDRSIAVLSFQNLSGAPQTAWLSSAFREVLYTDLSSGSELRLNPVESTARAEQELHLTTTDGLSHETLARICLDLGCGRVVSGSFLLANGQLRVDARVTDAETGRVLTTFSKTGQESDLFALMGATGADLRKSLGGESSLATQTPVPTGTVSANPEAYQFYIRGLGAISKRDGRAGVDLERQSIALDKSFPLSHLALSRALATLGEQREAVDEARRAAALDRSLPREQQLQIEAQAAHTERRFDDAAGYYQTLSQYFPNKPEYLLAMAESVSASGQPERAVALLEPLMRSREAGAEDPDLDSVLADCYALAGNWPKSETWAARGVAVSHQRGAIVLEGRLLTSQTQALLYMHRAAEALTGTQRALAIAEQFGDYSGELRALNRLGQVELALGQPGEAQKTLGRALDLEQQHGEMQRQLHTLSALGQLRTQQGDRNGAASYFDQELSLAKTFHQAAFTVQAELDVDRNHFLMHPTAANRAMLEHVAGEAAALGDKQTVAEAKAALERTIP